MRKKVLLFFVPLLAVVACIGFVACGDDDEKDTTSLTLIGLDKQFSSETGNVQDAQLLEIKCNSSWTISSKPDWIDMDVMSGEKDKTVRVWANSENTTGAERVGKIIVKSGTIERSKEVTQLAKGKQKETIVVPLTISNTLIVKFDSPLPAGATIKYGLFTYTAMGGETEVIIDPAAATGTLTLGGTLIAQSLKVSFGDRSTLVFEFDVASSTSAAQETANDVVNNGKTVSNDNSNKSNTGVAASFTLAAGTTPNTIGLTNNYSLVVFTPAYIPVAKVEKTDYNYAPYAVACQPDGATFDKPAKLSVTVEGANEIGDAGFQYQNGNEKPTTTLNGDNVEAEVSHFSIWNIILRGTCVNIEESLVQIATGSLTAGLNRIAYNESRGFSSDVRGILARWLKCLFGATETRVQKSTTIDAMNNGTYTVYQKKYEYTFKAGNKVFRAKVYGEVSCEVSYE